MRKWFIFPFFVTSSLYGQKISDLNPVRFDPDESYSVFTGMKVV
jgi:hypothetical protein